MHLVAIIVPHYLNVQIQIPLNWCELISNNLQYLALASFAMCRSVTAKSQLYVLLLYIILYITSK